MALVGGRVAHTEGWVPACPGRANWKTQVDKIAESMRIYVEETQGTRG
jgi:hypothetical protein